MAEKKGSKYADLLFGKPEEEKAAFVVFPGEEESLTILERNPEGFKKGGAIKKTKISDNPDTMRLELMKAKG